MTARFQGFLSEGLAFLGDLARHQDRDWFNAHRQTYDAALKGPMIDLVLDLADIFARDGVPLRGDPKRNVFRIHRDVRFSQDKSPYKTHIGATLTANGSKLSFGVLYMHIDPKGSFAACGFYMPEPRKLEALRQALIEDPDAWRSVGDGLAASGLAVEPDEAALKRLPRGYERVADPETQDMLKRKSWIVRRPLSTAEIADPGLVAEIAAFGKAALPLLRFGLQATGRG
jgi:uncharacterized protein (TIGR02453 family)